MGQRVTRRQAGHAVGGSAGEVDELRRLGRKTQPIGRDKRPLLLTLAMNGSRETENAIIEDASDRVPDHRGSRLTAGRRGLPTAAWTHSEHRSGIAIPYSR